MGNHTQHSVKQAWLSLAHIFNSLEIQIVYLASETFLASFKKRKKAQTGSASQIRQLKKTAYNALTTCCHLQLQIILLKGKMHSFWTDPTVITGKSAKWIILRTSGERWVIEGMSWGNESCCFFFNKWIKRTSTNQHWVAVLTFQAVENNDGTAERHWRPVASWEEEYEKKEGMNKVSQQNRGPKQGIKIQRVAEELSWRNVREWCQNGGRGTAMQRKWEKGV